MTVGLVLGVDFQHVSSFKNIGYWQAFAGGLRKYDPSGWLPSVGGSREGFARFGKNMCGTWSLHQWVGSCVAFVSVRFVASKSTSLDITSFTFSLGKVLQPHQGSGTTANVL